MGAMTDAMMTTPDRPKRGSNAAHGPVLVSGNKLAVHFGVVRQRIDQLTAQGVIERRADGLFDQELSRLKYFDHLRSEHQRSPGSAAEAAHALAKTELLRLRIEEKMRTLVRRDEHEAMIDQMAGLVLTKLGGWPARVAGADLVMRRKAEAVLRGLRVEISKLVTKLADESNEPQLDEAFTRDGQGVASPSTASVAFRAAGQP
jgi:hypothetical protein